MSTKYYAVKCSRYTERYRIQNGKLYKFRAGLYREKWWLLHDIWIHKIIEEAYLVADTWEELKLLMELDR